MALNPTDEKYSQRFNEASGYDIHDQQAAFDSNTNDPIGQLIRAEYERRKGMNGSAREDDEEKKEETSRFIANAIDIAIHKIELSYYNPEFDVYNGFKDSQQWQNYANPIHERAYDLQSNTLLIDKNNDSIFVPIKNESGETAYFKVTDKGLIEDTSVDPIWLQKITKETSPNGDLKLYIRGELADQKQAEEITSVLKNNGIDITSVTQDNSEYKKATADSNIAWDAEDKCLNAEIFLENSEQRLTENYSNENFLAREESVIYLKTAQAELKSMTGTPQEIQEAKLAIQKLQEYQQKMNDLNASLAKASPEEANRIMAATFGDKYNLRLAQEAQESLKNTGLTMPQNTSRDTASYAPSGIKTETNLSAAFGKAAQYAPDLPAPAQQAPGLRDIPRDPAAANTLPAGPSGMS